MGTLTSLDILHLASALAILLVGGFLSWALYELAKMLHQANALVTDTRDKINRIEQGIRNSVAYLGSLADGGKALLSFLHTKEEKKERRRSKGRIVDEDEE